MKKYMLALLLAGMLPVIAMEDDSKNDESDKTGFLCNAVVEVGLNIFDRMVALTNTVGVKGKSVVAALMQHLAVEDQQGPDDLKEEKEKEAPNEEDDSDSVGQKEGLESGGEEDELQLIKQLRDEISKLKKELMLRNDERYAREVHERLNSENSNN